MKHKPGNSGKEGMVLFAVMAILSGMAMISGTMFLLTNTDIKMTGSYREGVQAFYQADSGANYIKAQIEALLSAGSLNLSGASASVNITAPAGYTFDPVTSLSRQVALSNSVYLFSVTGRASNSNARVDVTFRRRPAMKMGVFADGQLDMKANGSIYSYYSDVTPNPTAANSTGEGDAGANGNITTHVGTYVDGDLQLGADSFGNTATRSDPGDGSTITGQENVQIGHVDADPLGAVGGSLAATFVAVSAVNNNAAAGIPANKAISLGNGGSMTLPAGNYYVSSIDLKNGATLNINAAAGPVNIYLTGGANFKNGSMVNVTGSPTNFRIFSNSSQSITLYHGSAYKGLIYAPFSSVEVKNSGDFYGVVWSKNVDIKNSGEIFVDLSLLNRFMSNKIQLLTWKESR